MNKKTIKKTIFWVLPAILIGGGIFLGKNNNMSPEKAEAATVFYSPNCSCCEKYIPYLKRNGFEVSKREVRDILSVKEEHGIPREMESCHTSIIGDYFVEGHVPVEAINKLLEERPKIAGIALPGMPQGSPGMPGFKSGTWKVYGLSENGEFNFLSL